MPVPSRALLCVSSVHITRSRFDDWVQPGGRDMADADELSTEKLLEALKALANPARLEIMDWLREPEAEFAAWEPIADRSEVGVCASHIQAKAELAQSTVSSYMNTLERAGLVISTRIGKWTHYRRNEVLLARIGRLSPMLGPRKRTRAKYRRWRISYRRNFHIDKP